MSKKKKVRSLHKEKQRKRDVDLCPECLRRGRRKRRPGERMVKHYQLKHPAERIPYEYYKGQRNMWGYAIPPYSGNFPVGTRVKVVGFEDMTKVCPECGKVRSTRMKMRKHFDKKHKSRPYPDKPPISMHMEVAKEIEDGDLELGFKGTVSAVTPFGYGGPRTPAVLHVRLDEPVDIHASGRHRVRDVYYSLSTMSLLEVEVKKLVRKKKR